MQHQRQAVNAAQALLSWTSDSLENLSKFAHFMRDDTTGCWRSYIANSHSICSRSIELMKEMARLARLHIPIPSEEDESLWIDAQQELLDLFLDLEFLEEKAKDLKTLYNIALA